MPDTPSLQQKGGNGANEKRKPVRRDPEKRRQQNIQAQRKYSECASCQMGPGNTTHTDCAI